MKKLALAVVAVVALAVPAQAAAPTHNGSFTFVKYGPNYKHRVFLEIEADHGGDKQCSVTLNGRTQEVDLGTDGASGRFNMFFLFTHGAAKAAAQAEAASSPTKRIRCSH